MASLFSLLVGINDYPAPVPGLTGCLNDVSALAGFLNSRQQLLELEWKNQTLCNQEATREAVIKGFSALKSAGPEDTILFYFSGHGSRVKSLPVFRHIDIHGWCESLVLYDSRLPGGRDLLDKELSVLIYEVTSVTKAHFVVLIDACHAGSVTRDSGQWMRPRLTDPTARIIDLATLYGAELFSKEADKWDPPVGPQIALAAARTDESAVETLLEGNPKGLFTSCLLDFLNHTPVHLQGYAQLMARVGVMVSLVNPRQHPQLEAVGESRQSLFLQGKPGASFLAEAYAAASGVWKVDIGAMHGLSSQQALKIRSGASWQSVAILQLGATGSILKMPSFAEPGKRYPVQVTPLTRLLPIAINPEKCNEIDRLVFYREMPLDIYLELDPRKAKYWIESEKGTLRLVRPGSNRPVFKALPSNEKGIQLFLENLGKVARWESLLQLSNPFSQIPPEDLAINWQEILPGGELRPLDQFEVACLEQTDQRDPVVQLFIQNKGAKRYYVGGLYFSEDYGITGDYLPVCALDPGNEPYFLGIYRQGQVINQLSLYVPDEVFDWGENLINNYLVILISTAEFKMDWLEQTPLELEPAATTRGGGRKPLNLDAMGEDWKTQILSIQIERKA